MSHEAPQAASTPLVTSEMVPQYPNFAEGEQKLQLEAASLVSIARDNPNALGEVRDDKSESIGGAQHANLTTYSVEKSGGFQSNETPSYRFVVDRKVSPGLEDKASAGRIEVEIDGGGSILHSEAYTSSAAGGRVDQELSPGDALNAASEALSVVRTQNEINNREQAQQAA